MQSARYFLVVLVVTLTSGKGLAQRIATLIDPNVQDVSYCELVSHPEKYNAHTIRVRGWVSSEFEDFTLNSDECGGRWTFDHFSVWLEYGDSDWLRHVNHPDRMSGLPGFRRDQRAQQMKEALQAYRIVAPDGEECGPENRCRFYKVYIEAVGIFMAHSPFKTIQDMRKKNYQSFGHMGCCHLLIMTDISQVDAQRTKVPFGGEFTCSKETWQPTAAEWAEITGPPVKESGDRLKDLDAGRERRRQSFRRLAQHWGDELDVSQFSGNEGIPGIATGGIRSENLLKTYEIAYAPQPKRKGKKKTTSTQGLEIPTITRERCEATEPPIKDSKPIECRHEYLLSKQSVSFTSVPPETKEELARRVAITTSKDLKMSVGAQSQVVCTDWTTTQQHCAVIDNGGMDIIVVGVSPRAKSPFMSAAAMRAESCRE